MELPYQRLLWFGLFIVYVRFNPCFNGIAISTSVWIVYKEKQEGVSILVLMELPYQRKLNRRPEPFHPRFNPCFNGIAISTQV